MDAQRIAIIDLGSNTARLILINAMPGNAYHLEDEIREVVRLRQGMTAKGLLVNIGGGSVQIAQVRNHHFERGCSLPLGALALMVLMQLSAILRLAEFLERGRNATVDDVTAVWDNDTLRLTLISDEYPDVELWEAERNALGLMETAFNRRLILESTAAPDDWIRAEPQVEEA